MSTSLIDADSLLAIDVGSVTTRAALFDVVDGRYRYLASGSAPTTAYAPFGDISEGVRQALDHLQAVTGRRLVGPDERLIIPSMTDGSGVDTVAATLSVGAPLKVVAVGLLEDVSLESAKRLVTTTYARVIESISLNDRRKTEERIDTILRLRPDVILVAGGTNGGASRSVIKLLDAVGLASYLLPQDLRPEVLYAGNQALHEEVKNSLEKLGPLHLAANIRPDLETEQIEDAKYRLAELARNVRIRRIGGVKDLDSWSGGGMLPTATAFGRVIQYLSQVYDSTKGVLGVDIGASATVLSAAFSGDLTQGVYPQFGLGPGLANLLDFCAISDITRWLHLNIHEDDVRHYLQNKALYPASLPATQEELAIEQALARQMMRLALKKTTVSFPAKVLHHNTDLLPWFEPIVACGSVLTRAPNLSQSTLMLLDGLQPTGVTTLGLDQNHLAASLGAAASINPILAVQVLEANTLLNLGTVISPIGEARSGTPVLRIRVKYDGGSESTVDVKQGTIEVLQLPMGQVAQLHLQPLHRYDVGMGGSGRGGRLRVVGGALGVIIDARGRPLPFAEDPSRRQELIGKWRWMLGC